MNQLRTVWLEGIERRLETLAGEAHQEYLGRVSLAEEVLVERRQRAEVARDRIEERVIDADGLAQFLQLIVVPPHQQLLARVRRVTDEGRHRGGIGVEVDPGRVVPPLRGAPSQGVRVIWEGVDDGASFVLVLCRRDRQ